MNETPTPRTDAAARNGAYYTDADYSSTHGKQLVHIDFARQLERELAEVKDALWPDQTGLPNEHRNAAVAIKAIKTLSAKRIEDLESQLAAVTAERDEARDQLFRICKDGFDNQDTIGQEPADDYVLRQLNVLKMSLRFVEEERDGFLAQVSAMRETLEAIAHDGDDCQRRAEDALSTPAPAVVPMEDVEPLRKFIEDVACPCRGSKEEAWSIQEAAEHGMTTLNNFNAKHPKP